MRLRRVSLGRLADDSFTGLFLKTSAHALFGGLILMTDMRLLGLALTDYSIGDVAAGLRSWRRLRGTVMIGSGLMLGSSEADKYYGKPFFWNKLTLLACIAVHALIFRPIVYNQTKEIDALPAFPTRAKVVAILSLVASQQVLSPTALAGAHAVQSPLSAKSSQ
jgi:hypothetical protein